MRKRLVVTADDFGRALPVNAAVEAAHRHGILTAASLMVTGAAVADAVERARRLPALAVGLHLVLVDGQPALPPERLPSLVGPDGRFGRRLLSLGVRLALDPEARRQAREELRAQFERYRATGLALDHVDSHHHYHLHPTVFAMVLDLAAEYGAAGIRVPYEPPFAAWRAARTGLGDRLVRALFHNGRTATMRRLIRGNGMVCNDQMFGLGDSGRMDSALLAALLRDLPDGFSEIYAHPATGHWSLHPLPADYRCADEAAALADPLLADGACHAGIRLTSFGREAALRRRRTA